MANIPIERKGGTPWWTWLLALLAAIALIWFLSDLFMDDPDEVDDLGENVEVMEEPAVNDVDANTGLLTSAALLLDNPTTYVGREVEFENMRVTSVVGDSTFYASPVEGDVDRRFFVVLDEERTPGTSGIEGRYDVNAGQLLTIYGTVRRLGQSDPAMWGITGDESQRMMDDAIYIRAQRLDISEAELDQVEVD